MVMARLHVICGNCGNNEGFKYSIDPTGNCDNDGNNFPSVDITCPNCATMHFLGEDMGIPEDEDHKYRPDENGEEDEKK